MGASVLISSGRLGNITLVRFVRRVSYCDVFFRTRGLVFFPGSPRKLDLPDMYDRLKVFASKHGFEVAALIGSLRPTDLSCAEGFIIKIKQRRSHHRFWTQLTRCTPARKYIPIPIATKSNW